MMVVGANPTDGHPVFASRMKKRLRAGREADRRRSAPHRPGAHAACRGEPSPAAASRHQRRGADRAGACHRDRRPGEPGLRARTLRLRRRSPTGRRSWPKPRNSPEEVAKVSGVPAETIRAAARLYAGARNGAIYYGLGVTEHSQGSTAVMALANLAMATGNIGRPGVGINPLRGQNNVQGSCDMGSLPARASRLSPHLRSRRARDLRGRMGRDARPGAGPAHSQHDRRRAGWLVPGHLHPGRGHRAVRPRHQAHHRRPRGDGMRGGARPVPERDSELRARVPAGLHVPGEGRHVHQRRAPHQSGAQGDGAARPVSRTGK